MTIYRLHFRESPTLHSVVSIVSATCSAPIQMTLFLLQPKIHPTFPSHGNSAMSFLSWRKKSFTSIVACWPWVYWNELLRSQVLCWAWQGGRITAHALENNELFEIRKWRTKFYHEIRDQYLHLAWISDVSCDVLNSCNSSPVREFTFWGNQQLFSKQTSGHLQGYKNDWTRRIQFSFGFDSSVFKVVCNFLRCIFAR